MVDFLIYFPICMIMYRFLRFVSTPLLKKLGFYQYYSPMFFTMPWFGGVRDIHMGTSWDYLKFRNKNTKILLMQLAAGLIQIIKEIEIGKIDRGVLFRGNSHFLSEDTLQKVGFSYRNPNLVENFLFFLTYLEDCILRSISARRLILIPFRNNKVVHFTGKDLLSNKERIKKIYLVLSGYKKRREESIPQIEMSEEFINVA